MPQGVNRTIQASPGPLYCSCGGIIVFTPPMMLPRLLEDRFLLNLGCINILDLEGISLIPCTPSYGIDPDLRASKTYRDPIMDRSTNCQRFSRKLYGAVPTTQPLFRSRLLLLDLILHAWQSSTPRHDRETKLPILQFLCACTEILPKLQQPPARFLMSATIGGYAPYFLCSCPETADLSLSWKV
ncbi:hypothetical protein BDV32DRAFT_131701, partial [Aspergillus pseudonomiae]